MRFITVVSLLAAGSALLSQSPVAYASPVPSEVAGAVAKRYCVYYKCRITDVDPDTGDITAQSGAEKLADELITALETFQAQNKPLNSNTSDTTVTLATPEDIEVY